MRAKLIQFVLEKASQEPLSKRAELYRELATILDDKKESQELIALAEELEQVESNTAEFVFNFNRR